MKAILAYILSMKRAVSAPKTRCEAILFFADYDNCRKTIEAIRWAHSAVVPPKALT